jgi:hypothetical protein
MLDISLLTQALISFLIAISGFLILLIINQIYSRHDKSYKVAKEIYLSNTQVVDLLKNKILFSIVAFNNSKDKHLYTIFLIGFNMKMLKVELTLLQEQDKWVLGRIFVIEVHIPRSL